MRVMGLKKMRIAVGIVLLVVLATGCSSGEKRADSLELIQKDGVMSVAVPVSYTHLTLPTNSLV